MSRFRTIADALQVIETYPLMKGFIGDPLPNPEAEEVRKRRGISAVGGSLDDEFHSAVMLVRAHAEKLEDEASRSTERQLKALDVLLKRT